VRRRIGSLPSPSVALAVLVLALVACTGERATLSPDAAPAGAGRDAKVATLDPRAVDLTLVATATVALVEVFEFPDAADARRVFTNPRPSGAPLLFVVDRSIEGWHEVLLPVEPAGATGWVRTTDVTVAQHNVRIEVRLGDRMLDVHQNGAVTRQVAIGFDPGNVPDPGGRHYTTELLAASDTSDYGAFAYGLSGWGDAPTTFAAEAGQYGIHGTADLTTIGDASVGAASPGGSIRMADADIRFLAENLPLGVPVTITA
jgi:lipoprotein-anchoring transpeptidase ErfK/SrfK